MVAGCGGALRGGPNACVPRSAASCLERAETWPQAADSTQDRGEQDPLHYHLSQLEHHVWAVAHDPGADPDQFYAERRQRPLFDLFRQSQRAQEVGDVVGERASWRRTELCRKARRAAERGGGKECARTGRTGWSR